MPNPSLSALSRLSSLRPPPGAPIDEGRDPEAVLGDQVEAETGLNPTAMQELGLARLHDEEDQMDTARGIRHASLREADARFKGPEGWDRVSPAMASLANLLEGKRQGVDLEGELQPEIERQADITSEGAARRKMLPEAERESGRQQRDILERLHEQYAVPAQDRSQAAITAAETRAKGDVDAATARAKTAQDRASQLFGDLIRYGRVTDAKTGQPRPYTPEEIAQKQRDFGIELPPPAGMVMMRGPDGSVKPVAPGDVAHYKALGAEEIAR